MAAEGLEERKRQERIHRKVSVAYDCYGAPDLPDVVGIGKADPLESMLHTIHNRNIRRKLKKNNEAGDFGHISQMMVLDFSHEEAQQVKSYPRNPTKLHQHPEANAMRKKLKEENRANHVMQKGQALKQLFKDETNDLALQDFVTRPMKTVTKGEAEQHFKDSDSRRARARVKALVASDNVDMWIPTNHELIKQKGAENAILNLQFKKICEPIMNPQHFPEGDLIAGDIKAQRAENKAKKAALSRTSINFQDDGYDVAQTYRSSCFMSCHSDSPVNSSLERLPFLSKNTKKTTISHSLTSRSAPELKLPPL